MQRYNRDSRIESRRPNLSQKKGDTGPCLAHVARDFVCGVALLCAPQNSLFTRATEAARATRGVGELLYLLPFHALVASHNQLCNTFAVVHNELTIR